MTTAAAAPPRWRRRWHHARGRFRRSLRWRLVGLFLLMALATAVIFVAGMQQVVRGGWQGYVRPLVGNYLDLLAAEIGTPPDPARAQALVDRLPLSIRIDGPTVHWSSDDGRARRGGPMPWRWRPFGGDGAAGDARDDTPDDRPGEEGGWWQTRQLADGHRIVFGLAAPPGPRHARYAGWVTLALLLAITALAHAYVRRLLRPLDDIRDGALRFGRGEFGRPIVPRRDDELGELAERINTMAAELHRMLDAKRALLLAISHELRSPLTRARLNAELVDEGAPRDALLRDLALMRDLVTDLLESERLAAGHATLQTEPTRLADLVREVVETQFADAPLDLQLDDTLPPLPLDRARVRLLVRNLIGNALRHGGNALRHGGNVQRPGAQATRVTVAADPAQPGTALLAVRDHGPGVPDEHLPHLADAFYRADSARQRATGGVGLGLYLCRLVVQAHGGALVIRNAQPGLEVTASWPATATPRPPA